MEHDENAPAFDELGLPVPLLQTLDKLGYKTPSPIQAQAIPHLLEGRDLLGMAQTGTGKTAAFSLPLMAKLLENFGDSGRSKKLSALVLAPTRELAQQVAEAMNTYGSGARGCRVLAVYGGAPFGPQARELRGGIDVVVGTPGRVMDHMRRGNLNVSELQVLVLDEADEMLRMGFIDDVEWVLEQTPDTRQIALFSATMPNEIARIAKRHLNDPAEVRIKQKSTTAASIRQRFVMVHGGQKREALARLLEVEQPDATMVFVRTKAATAEVAEFLRGRGHAAEELSGDLSQEQRDKAVQRLKSGRTDILVATDVAARGLDVERISHVVNYDMPGDPEVYTHRIGRTGRAGRSGEAILFAQPRERRMLRLIGNVTRSEVLEMTIPTVKEINVARELRLGDTLKKHVESDQQGTNKNTQKILDRIKEATGLDDAELALALATELNRGRPFLLSQEQELRSVGGGKQGRERNRNERGGGRDRRPSRFEERKARGERSAASGDWGDQPPRQRPERSGERPNKFERKPRENRPEDSRSEQHRAHKQEAVKDSGHPRRPLSTRFEDSKENRAKDTQRYRIEVGREHGVQPGNIVGAIANEAGLDSNHIGRIELQDRHSFVDLPAGMPKEVFNHLKTVWVCGQKLSISNATGAGAGGFKDRGRQDRDPSVRPNRGDRKPRSGRPANKADVGAPRRKKLKMKVGAAKAHGRRIKKS